MLIHKLHNLCKKIFNKEETNPKNKKQIISILRKAEEQSILGPNILAIIESVLQASEMKVEDVMIPKKQTIVLHKDDSIEKALNLAVQSSHSRFPVVIDESQDEVAGIILSKDLLAFAVNQEKNSNKDKHNYNKNFRDIIRPAIFVPQSTKLYPLLNEFQKTHNHIAIVVDEYGNFAGLVTIEDILEQIVGEIEDEHDFDEELNILKHDDHRYSIKAITPLEEFNEYFKTDYDDTETDTVGGLIIRQLNRVPQRDEEIKLGIFTFIVVRADKRRVHLLKIIKKQ